MDTELLKTFIEVARTRHFGRAAENLYLTQSAVSFRVRQLEGLLGSDLFYRQRNNIRLTSAGEALLPLAENSLELEQKMRMAVSSAEHQKNALGIGGTPNLWDAFLQQALTQCQTLLPDTSFQALAHSSTTLLRQILEGVLDLAFVFDAPKVDELETHSILDIDLYLVADKPYASATTAMATNYVLIDWGTAFHLQHGQTYPDSPAVAVQTNTGRIALDCLLNNGGAAYLPLTLVQPYLDTKALYVVSEAQVISRTVYASWLVNTDKAPLIENLIAHLRSNNPKVAVSLAPTHEAGNL